MFSGGCFVVEVDCCTRSSSVPVEDTPKALSRVLAVWGLFRTFSRVSGVDFPPSDVLGRAVVETACDDHTVAIPDVTASVASKI